MKKSVLKILLLGLAAIFSIVSVVSAYGSDYGSAGAKEKTAYTLEDMLKYAIENEYLAKAEYEKIMELYGEQKPFSNIIKSEDTHISLLKPLFEKYGFPIPVDIADNLVVDPNSLPDAMKTGVNAEIANIRMYESFLEQELPEDVRNVFTRLRNASQNHLSAFERGVAKEETGFGSNNYNGNGKQGKFGFRRNK